MTHVLIHGNPMDGLSLLGPLSSEAEATFQRGLARFDLCWVVEVESPDVEFAAEFGRAFLLYGNPVDGLGVIGPFDDTEVAGDYGVDKKLDYWWSVEAQPPEPDYAPSP